MELIKHKYGLFVDSYSINGEYELLTALYFEMAKDEYVLLNDKYLEVIKDIFEDYLKNSEYKDILDNISVMHNRGINITLTSRPEKDEAFKIFKNLCDYFDVFGSKFMDEKSSEFDKKFIKDVRRSREILKAYYDDVINSNLYEYVIVK